MYISRGELPIYRMGNAHFNLPQIWSIDEALHTVNGVLIGAENEEFMELVRVWYRYHAQNYKEQQCQK